MRLGLIRRLAQPSPLRALTQFFTASDLTSVSITPTCCQISCSVVSVKRQLRSIYGLAPSPALQSSSARWIEPLLFRQRLHGDDGVQAVWYELRQANVDLPTAGQPARIFWEHFLASEHILHHVINYAVDLKERSSSYYKPLYENIIGQCLAKGRLRHVHTWHNTLSPMFPPAPGAMRRLASKINGSKLSVDVFSYIYTRSHERNVYDPLISSLCNKQLWRRALRCHRWLIQMNDLPSGTSMHPDLELAFREVLFACGEVSEAGKRPAAGLKASINPRLSRETMNRVLGEVHGVQPKKMDDRFCARIFATKAFSIEAIIGGLGMFGVEEIGPLALREMASRIVAPRQISLAIQRLSEIGISIGQTVYSQALRKFADDNRDGLVQSLITTDQHPDAFEDRGLQRRLLATFIEGRRWDEVQRTLAILTIFHLDSPTEQWNVLVRSLAKQRHTQLLCQILEDMQSQRIRLTGQSQSALQAYQLRPRRKGNAPVAGSFDYDDTTLNANIWRGTLASGGYVSCRRWIEIFKRYGTTERFAEVSKLALWLADWYSPYRPAAGQERLQDMLRHRRARCMPAIQHALPAANPRHPLRQVFPNKLLRAFIAWGIRRAFVLPMPSAPAKSQKPEHYWAQGLRLCTLLRKRGIYVSSKVVGAELRVRLVHLFGHGRSNRAYNRRSAANNPYSVLEMIECANALWIEVAGKPLLDPRELVAAAPSHCRSAWWAKRLSRDFRLRVRAALDDGNPLKPLKCDRVDVAHAPSEQSG